MHQFSKAWAQIIIRFRAAILVFTAILLAMSPLSFDRLYHDDSNESYFLENDPNLKAFDALLDRFGDVEYLLVGVPARAGDRDVFNADTLQMIAEITEFLANHRFVTQTRSLTDYEYTHDDDGMLATDDLIEDVDSLAQNPEALAQARQVMAGERLALGSLITRDFQHTVIAARTEYKPRENAHKVALVTELRTFINEQGYRDRGFTLHMSGVPVVSERFETLTKRDMAWINPVMMVVMVAILFAIFRSLMATSLPFLLIGCTVLLTTAIQGWLRWPFTAVNSALIPTIIILSVGASIHVLVEFLQFRRQGLAPKEAARATVVDLLFPVFFTCLTTAVGFATLAITELSPVRQFSLLAATGAALIFLVAMTVLPAVLSFIPWGLKPLRSAVDHQPSLLSRLLHHLPDIIWRKRKTMAIIGSVITVFSLYNLKNIEVDTNIVNYFKEGSWINRDLAYFNEHFKGISNLEIIVDSGEQGGVKNPDLLERADALQSYMESLPETGTAISILRFYKQINQALSGDDSDAFTLPTTSPMAAQFLLLYENTGPDEDLSDLKDFEERYLRISIPVLNMDARKTTALIAEIEQHFHQNFADLDIEITGALVMNNAQNRYVNNGMFRSFGVAIIAIGLCFFVLFRSFKHGLIALIPSVVPILLTGGLISLAGIALDLGTMIVGAMTIGLAVDDSIHVMSRYRLHRARGTDSFAAIRGALASSGKAVVLTSMILVCGFSVMLLGSFVSYIYVGLFSAMIMAFALVGDLLFMPALLFLFDRCDGEQTATRQQNPVTTPETREPLIKSR